MSRGTPASGGDTAARSASLGGAGDVAPSVPHTDGRWSAWSFAAVMALFLVSRLLIYSDSAWFARDDWGLIGSRNDLNVDALLADHNQHWVSASVLMYRALYLMFGLNSYLPYVLTAALIIAGTAYALREVMRRSGVGPWTSTVVAAAFPFMCPAGGQSLANVLLLSSLLFGLVQLLLIDRAGPWSARDWLALIAGVAAITSSGAGVPVLVGVGLFALIRRGWRFCVLQFLPLALLFALWWSQYAPRDDVWLPPISIGPLWDWLMSAAVGTAMAAGASTVSAVLLVVVTASGVVALLVPDSRRSRLTEALPALCLLAIPVVFAVFTYAGRWLLGPAAAQDSRYMALAVACVLPLVALAIDSLGQIHPALFLALAIPWLAAASNTVSLVQSTPEQQIRVDRARAATSATITAAAELDVPDDAPAFTGSRMGEGMGDTPVSFLRAAVASGRLDPAAWDPSPRALDEARLRLAFYPESVTDTLPTACTPRTSVLSWPAKAGDRVVVSASPLLGLSPVNVSTLAASGPVTTSLAPPTATTYRILAEQLDLVLAGTPEGAKYLSCPEPTS